MRELLAQFIAETRGAGSIERALMFCAIGSLVYGIGYSYAPNAKEYLEARLNNRPDTIVTATVNKQQTRVVRSVLPAPAEQQTGWLSAAGTGCKLARIIYVDSLIGC